MFEVSKTSALIMYESALLLLIAIGVLVAFSLMRRSDRNNATHSLKQEIDKKNQYREACLFNSLRDNFKLEGDALTNLSEKMRQTEKDFFSNVMVRVRKGNQQELIMGIHDDFYDVLDGYQALEPVVQVEVVEPDEEHWAPREDYNDLSDKFDRLMSDYEALQTANEKFSEQVTASTRDMDEMLTEYTNMFGNKDDQAAMLASKDRMLKFLDEKANTLSNFSLSEGLAPVSTQDEDQTLVVEDQTLVVEDAATGDVGLAV